MTYTERRVRTVRAPAGVLWQVVHDLGGESGYHAFDALWRVRATVDRAVGGPGMRGRPEQLADGDALDFWRVESVDPPHRLLLRAEMRMPGTARLELRVEALGDAESLLEQRTWFEPAGVGRPRVLVGRAPRPQGGLPPVWSTASPGRRSPTARGQPRMRQAVAGLDRLTDLDALVTQEEKRGSRAP